MSLEEPSLTSSRPSESNWAIVPSSVSFVSRSRCSRIIPPSSSPSLPLASRILIAAIFSRGDTLGVSITDPSRFVTRVVEQSRTISVRTDTISLIDHLFSVNARPISPGMKNPVRHWLPPTMSSRSFDDVSSPIQERFRTIIGPFLRSVNRPSRKVFAIALTLSRITSLVSVP